MKRVFIDTNVLLTLANKSRILDSIHENIPEAEIVVLEGILNELEKIEARGGADGRAAKLAKTIIKKQDLKTITHSQPYVDTALVAVANQEDAIITLDKELQSQARNAGIAVFTIARTQLRRVR